MREKWYLPVYINGLQQSEGDPGPEQHHMVAEHHNANEESRAQNQSLQRVGIFSLHPERRLNIHTIYTHKHTHTRKKVYI